MTPRIARARRELANNLDHWKEETGPYDEVISSNTIMNNIEELVEAMLEEVLEKVATMTNNAVA